MEEIALAIAMLIVFVLYNTIGIIWLKRKIDKLLTRIDELEKQIK